MSCHFATATSYSRSFAIGESEYCPGRCLGLSQQMKDLYAREELERPPNVMSYSTVMSAYAKAGRPRNAEDLFEKMYQGFIHGGRRHLKPDLMILKTLLEAWARADQVERLGYPWRTRKHDIVCFYIQPPIVPDVTT
jgi:pentatricopeptide repeat protein